MNFHEFFIPNNYQNVSLTSNAMQLFLQWKIINSPQQYFPQFNTIKWMFINL